MNVIPDWSEIEIDHRSFPGQPHSKVLDTVRKALPDFDLEVISDKPGLDTPADNAYIHRLNKLLKAHSASGKKNGAASKDGSFLTGAPWTADSLVMSQHGVPAIAFGPGSIVPAHTKDEYIEVDELERGVEVFRSFLEGLD